MAVACLGVASQALATILDPFQAIFDDDGARKARGDAGGSRVGPHINRAPMRDSRAIPRAPSGPVVPNQGSDGNPSEPDMTRQAPTGPDGSLDCPVLMYD